MRRTRTQTRSRSERLKAVPWPLLLSGGIAVGKRWTSLSDKERARLVALVRASGTRPHQLSAKERRELRMLVAKLELASLTRELAGAARGWRAQRRQLRWRSS